MAITDIVINGSICVEMSRTGAAPNDINTFAPCAEISRGNVGNLIDINYMSYSCNELSTDLAVFPSVSDVRIGVSFGLNATSTGTLIVGGAASGAATLTKDTTNARGGSGTCAKLVPTSTLNFGYWWFYIPATSTNPFVLSLYHRISTGWNGTLNITIYDVDQSTQLYTHSITTVNDGGYHQHSCSAVTPANTGVCLVKIGVQDGSVTGYAFIDDVSVA
jgi:hypothetical protein